jgi:hypothetical protein
MSKTKPDTEPQPHARDRDTATDRPRKRTGYTAGANGTKEIDAAEADQAESMQPDKDGTGW